MVNETIIRVALQEEKRLKKDVSFLEREINKLCTKLDKLDNELSNVRQFIQNEWNENREIINKICKEIENGGKEDE